MIKNQNAENSLEIKLMKSLTFIARQKSEMKKNLSRSVFENNELAIGVSSRVVSGTRNLVVDRVG